MAAAAPSPLASSEEKTNGAKLSRLVIDGGTTVLRIAFDSYHPPANLAAGLNANYLTLHNLLRKRVLRKAQWDQLFPPGGVALDSKAFDITLLFLLLTNICGLTPPPSGWHAKPPPSDTSPEANLARIKYFRNELYGHVTTTGADALTFNALWLEISAVLVALGLDQAEIDRLKAEHCGEDDYLDVLLDWTDSEEDIKSQLKEMRQCQTETQQDVGKVLETQLEDRKTLEDSKAKLDEVHQTQTSIKGTVERVCQTQQEDRKTLVDSKSKLDEVHQTQTSIQGTVERAAKTQENHFEAVESGLQEIKEAVGSLKGGRDTESQEDEVLRNLAKSEFKGDIEYHVGRFQEGTREWVFNKVQNWLDDRNSQNRVMVISANAGMGKSVISAVICQRMQEDGRLSGSHFCQHNNARYRNPQLMLQSLACHLCHALPEYKQALAKQLSRNLGEDLNNMGVEELFALLFKEPLSTVGDPGRNMLMVIDGLDESEFQERNELLDVIANHFCKLPCWIRFVCTTRPERSIAKALKQLRPLQLEPNEEENVQDIRLFLEKRMQYLTKPENKGAIVEKLVEKSDGLMLYAYFLVSSIEENVSVLDQGDLDGSLPVDISSVYESYFKRLENELMKDVGVKEEKFLNLLSAVSASREPLPIDFVSKILVPSADSPVKRRKIRNAVSSVSSLLPIRDECLHVFHKSVKDWLTDSLCYGEHDFLMDEKDGHRILASLCSDELDNLKQKGVHDTQFSCTEKYELNHGVRHVLQVDKNMSSQSLEECVQKYVTDLELVYANLCIDDSIAAEDILWFQRETISQILSEDIRYVLNTLAFLLRKYLHTITNLPHVFLQTVLNEGGRELSSEASDLLQNKYPDIPYMEFVHKQMQQGAVQARFQCSSQVACMDVSPQLDYMVCECKDGTIQLWSLDTGKLVWTRPVRVKKLYLPFSNALRELPSSSGVFLFYRSVAFHPTEEIVLPGDLSYAYTFDGYLKPLFPESKCRFTVCSISGDKTKMLTDCHDDAKCIVIWSLENGCEITRTTTNDDVLSFAWSRDGKLLAISHSTGAISIVDAMDGFRPLAETDLSEICGMMKFLPDCQSLFCLREEKTLISVHRKHFRLDINMGECTNCTLDVCRESYVPWQCESHSEAGYLLGDPISSCDEAFDFVINNQTVLRGRVCSRFIDMLDICELRKTDKDATVISISDIAFSLSGETVYFVSVATKTTVSAWDVSSGEVIGEKSMMLKGSGYKLSHHCNRLVTVKAGVLLRTTSASLELWNSELSQCVRNWADINGIRKMIPISEERVACEADNHVIILDTTSGEIVSTIPTRYVQYFVACNSKCQLLTYKSRSLQLSDGKTTLWRKKCNLYFPRGFFSLSEQFVIIIPHLRRGANMAVLDAISGETLHILPEVSRYIDFKFISDEECVISCQTSRDYCLQLFNVKSGDLLSDLHLDSEANCLAACPCKRLLAIAQRDSKHGFKLIQVQLPQDKDTRKSKR